MEYASEQEVELAVPHIRALQKSMNGVLFGQSELIDLVITGLLARGHILLEGLPGWGVLLRDGRVCPVKEVLAADKAADIAIFRVEGEGFNALKLGEPQKVGGEVHIIAHPDSRFFTYTAGLVSRYYTARSGKSAKTIWMAVTAEFARGSSGGPVLDECGNVVGMVANTQSIYYPKKKKSDLRGPFQMVIRNCVRVVDIQKLIEAK